jgi:hypothetical protein
MKLIFVSRIPFLVCEVENECINAISINFGLQRAKATLETYVICNHVRK